MTRSVSLTQVSVKGQGPRHYEFRQDVFHILVENQVTPMEGHVSWSPRLVQPNKNSNLWTWYGRYTFKGLYLRMSTLQGYLKAGCALSVKIWQDYWPFFPIIFTCIIVVWCTAEKREYANFNWPHNSAINYSRGIVWTILVEDLIFSSPLSLQPLQTEFRVQLKHHHNLKCVGNRWGLASKLVQNVAYCRQSCLANMMYLYSVIVSTDASKVSAQFGLESSTCTMVAKDTDFSYNIVVPKKREYVQFLILLLLHFIPLSAAFVALTKRI